MVTFSEFMINLFQKLGIYYIFSIIFIALVVYVLSLNLLKKFSKDFLDDKKINVISILISISVAILASPLYRISHMFSYFLALVSSMTVVLLFTYAILIFFVDKKPTVSETGVRNIFIVILLLITSFIFISFYFAFQDVLYPLIYSGSSQEGLGGQYDIFSHIFRAEILIIPFLFVIMGLAIMILGAGQDKNK
ncbi:MAG: hypothetical protein QXD60_03490 [Nanopusillaceae archaeon]